VNVDETLNFMYVLLECRTYLAEEMVGVASCLASSKSGNFSKAVDCGCLDYYHEPSELPTNLEIVYAPSKCAISKANMRTYQVLEGTTQQKLLGLDLLSIPNRVWGLQGVKNSQSRLAYHIKGFSQMGTSCDI